MQDVSATDRIASYRCDHWLGYGSNDADELPVGIQQFEFGFPPAISFLGLPHRARILMLILDIPFRFPLDNIPSMSIRRQCASIKSEANWQQTCLDITLSVPRY